MSTVNAAVANMASHRRVTRVSRVRESISRSQRPVCTRTVRVCARRSLASCAAGECAINQASTIGMSLRIATSLQAGRSKQETVRAVVVD